MNVKIPACSKVAVQGIFSAEEVQEDFFGVAELGLCSALVVERPAYYLGKFVFPDIVVIV